MLPYFLLPKYESETLFNLPLKLAKLIVRYVMIEFISRYWKSFLSVVYFSFFPLWLGGRSRISPVINLSFFASHPC